MQPEHPRWPAPRCSRPRRRCQRARPDPRLAHVTTFEQATVSLLRRTSERITARAQRRANRKTTVSVGTVRRVTLMVGALASFTYAASTWHEWAGFVVGGAAALYLEQSLSDD